MCFLVEATEYDLATSQQKKPYGVCLCGREKLVARLRAVHQQVEQHRRRQKKVDASLARELTEASVQLEANVGVLHRWEHVRYQLEKKRGMVITELFAFQTACENGVWFPGADNATSSIIAQVVTPGERRERRNIFPLSDDTDLTKLLDKVIVWQRHPNVKDPERGKPVKNTYIPERFIGEADEVERECLVRAIASENKSVIDEIDQRWLSPKVPGNPLKYLYPSERFRLALIKEVTALMSSRQRTKHNKDTVMACFREFAASGDPAWLDKVKTIPFAPVGMRLWFKRATRHPSYEIIERSYPGFLDKDGKEVAWATYEKPPPPTNYVCSCCWNYFEPPHACEDCPGRRRKDWVWMSKRPRPHGLFGLKKVAWDAPVELVEAARWIKDDVLLIHPDRLGELLRERMPPPPPPPPEQRRGTWPHRT